MGKISTFILIPIITIFLINCSNSVVSDGGSVSDVGNPCIQGIVLGLDSSKSKNIEVTVFSLDHNPVSESQNNNTNTDTTDSNGLFKIFIEDTISQYSIQAKGINSPLIKLIRGINSTNDTNKTLTILLKQYGSINIIFDDTNNVTNGYIYIPGSNIYKRITQSDLIYKNEKYHLLFDSIPQGEVGEINIIYNNNEKTIETVTDSLIIPSDDTVNVHINNFWSVYNSSNSNLPEDSITAILSNVNNLLWIGTAKNGIFTFSNNTWNQLPQSQNLSISSLKKIYTGEIWIGTTNGLYSYSNSILSPVDTISLPSNHITSIEQDNQNRIWLGTAHGCVKIEEDTIKLFDTSSIPLKENYITAINVTLDSNIVICTPLGFVSYNNNSWEAFYKGDANCEITDTISDVEVNLNGKLYFATKSGVFVLLNSIWYSFSTINEGISNNQFTTIIRDQENNIWAGTANEAHIYKLESNFGFKFDYSNAPLLNNIGAVISSAVSEDNKVYFGTSSNGLLILNPASN